MKFNPMQHTENIDKLMKIEIFWKMCKTNADFGEGIKFSIKKQRMNKPEADYREAENSLNEIQSCGNFKS
jgi:hypothetical protein